MSFYVCWSTDTCIRHVWNTAATIYTCTIPITMLQTLGDLSWYPGRDVLVLAPRACWRLTGPFRLTRETVSVGGAVRYAKRSWVRGWGDVEGRDETSGYGSGLIRRRICLSSSGANGKAWALRE